MRPLALAALLVAAPAAAQASGGGAGDAPADRGAWEPVAAPPERRVYVHAQPAWVAAGVVDVWTWHTFATPYRPARGPAYDRVVAQDRVYCRLRATAPVREVRYAGGARVGAFMFPGDVGPFGWAPGSAAESVGERVCGR